MATQTSSTERYVLRIGNAGVKLSEALIDTLLEEAESRQVA